VGHGRGRGGLRFRFEEDDGQYHPADSFFRHSRSRHFFAQRLHNFIYAGHGLGVAPFRSRMPWVGGKVGG